MSEFWAALIFFILFVIALGFAWKIEEQTYVETEKHIETLSFRMKKVGEEALLQLPIGIILISEKNIIEWVNPYVLKIFESESLLGEDLFSLTEQFHSIVKGEDLETENLKIGDRTFKVVYKTEDKLLYLFDITERVGMKKLYFADRTVLAMILIDNYDDLAQAMDDQTKSQLNSLVTSYVNKWGTENGIFVCPIARIGSGSSILRRSILISSFLSNSSAICFAVIEPNRRPPSPDFVFISTVTFSICSSAITYWDYSYKREEYNRMGKSLCIKNL